MSEALKKAHEAMRLRKEQGIPLVRLDPIEKSKQNPKSLRLAINGKCWDCCLGQRTEIRDCQVLSCTLHHLRPYQAEDDDGE